MTRTTDRLTVSERATRFADDLTPLIRLRDQLALIERAMADCRLGTPGSGFGGSGSGSGGGSPVERALLGAGCPHGPADPCTCQEAMTADTGQAALDDLDAVLKAIRPLAQRAHGILTRWEPRAASAKDRRDLERINEVGTDCEHHAAAGIGEPSEHTGTVSGNLPHPMRLCGFCYREVRRKGRLPRAEVLELRKRTGKDPLVPA